MRGPLLQGPEHCPGGPEAEEPEGGGGEAGAALLWAGGDGAVPAHHTTTLDAQPARQDGSEVQYNKSVAEISFSWIRIQI